LAGQTKVFNGSISTAWDVSNNWTPAGIPTPADSVLISNGLAEIPDGYHASALYLEIRTSATLKIRSDIPNHLYGNLDIRNAPGSGINNEGTLINQGKIDIENSGQYGIHNDGTLHNEAMARIFIDTMILSGLKNLDTVFNQGILEIKYVILNNAYGIFNTGYFRNTGKIAIDSVAFAGIYCGNSLSVFENEDTIEVSHFSQFPAYANGGLELSNGVFNNKITGYLKIADSGTMGGGISCKSLFTNLGTIDVLHLLNYGILVLVDGSMTNEGDILIDDMTLGGLSINETGTYFQTGSGSITIRNTGGDGLTIDESTIVELEGMVDIH
jgi:hypothetical protein